MEREIALTRSRSGRLEELYARHAERAGRLAYLFVGDRDLAADIAQEAFTRLAARFGALRSDDAVGAYLRRCVINLARNHWRGVERERAFLRREGAAMVGRATWQPDVASRDALWEALGRLPYRQRAALVLRFYEDLSERQTARTLGCAVGTAKSLVSRGLERLRSEMKGDGDG